MTNGALAELRAFRCVGFCGTGQTLTPGACLGLLHFLIRRCSLQRAPMVPGCTFLRELPATATAASGGGGPLCFPVLPCLQVHTE